MIDLKLCISFHRLFFNIALNALKFDRNFSNYYNLNKKDNEVPSAEQAHCLRSIRLIKSFIPLNRNIMKMHLQLIVKFFNDIKANSLKRHKQRGAITTKKKPLGVFVDGSTHHAPPNLLISIFVFMAHRAQTINAIKTIVRDDLKALPN